MQEQLDTVQKQVQRLKHEAMTVCCPEVDLTNSIGNQQDDFYWESMLVNLIRSANTECLNIRSAVVSGAKAGDSRMLFMPHSPGIYVALVL